MPKFIILHSWVNESYKMRYISPGELVFVLKLEDNSIFFAENVKILCKKIENSVVFSNTLWILTTK